jgi:hypothetical protein
MRIDEEARKAVEALDEAGYFIAPDNNVAELITAAYAHKIEHLQSIVRGYEAVISLVQGHVDHHYGPDSRDSELDVLPGSVGRIVAAYAERTELLEDVYRRLSWHQSSQRVFTRAEKQEWLERAERVLGGTK